MGAEDNSSAESADIGEALVAALGFEPTDGGKRRGGSVSANDEEPSVDDAFIVVPSDAPDSDAPSEAELKAAAQPAVTVNGDNGSDNGNGSDSGNGGDSGSGKKSEPAKADSASDDPASDADDSADAAVADQNKSRKSKRRRSRSSNSKSASRSQGPAKMADKPPSAKTAASSDGEAEQIKSAAQPAVSDGGSDVSGSDVGGSDDQSDSWDMSESSNGSTAVDEAGVDKATSEPSSEVKAKVDEITAEAISSVAGKSDADLELDKAWEESQAAAKADSAAAKSKSKGTSKAKARSERSKSDSRSESNSGSKSDSKTQSAKSNDSKAIDSKTGESSSNDSKSGKRQDPKLTETKNHFVGDGPMAAAASVTGEVGDTVGAASEQLFSAQPPPPSAADAIKVVQPRPDGTMPATADSAAVSNVDELLAETVAEVPSSPPTKPATPAAAMPAVAEAVPAKVEAVPTAPANEILPKNRLEVRDDELAAQAEARLQPSQPSSGFDFSMPSLLRRKRRVQARKVRRVVRHIDPWSVLTFSVLFHLSVFAALLLASVLVWNAAEAAGTIENIEAFILDLGDYETFEIKGDVVFRAAVAIAGILTLASSVLLVLLTVVFNLISDLVGGIRLTVIEEETVRVRRKKKS